MKELEDRTPDFAGPRVQNVLVQEGDNEQEEIMKLLAGFSRKQRRKAIKPSFSNSVKTSFRKKVV